VHALLGRFAAAPFSPPSVKEAQAEAGEDVYNALVELGKLVPVSTEVVFRREDYERMVAESAELFARHGTLTAAQVRDHFNTSRRYVLAFLEHLDAAGVTAREGDVRRWRGNR
jgi:selenocysteine-specific elongation factor